MKKLTLFLIAFSIAAIASAQVPQALNYQAVARNSMGQIIPSQSIGVRFSITDASGTIVFYQETHNTTTNNFGLFTLGIGKGIGVTGTFSAIDWGNGDKFLKVEIAPQGGTNYAIQGITQLLSVPYALYAEKTNLVAGDGIRISKGNVISSNYVPGTGINIEGNIISARNAWLLKGNTGTTASNFLGTTDNLPVYFRTNNIQRLSISESTIAGTNNLSYVSAGQQSNFITNPMSIGVWGKDISGYTIPLYLAGNISGMTWSASGGSNNTLGRLIRLSQWVDPAGPNYNFFDIGIDQQSDFFIGDRGTWSGSGGQTPKKMITISPQDFVGINFSWGEHPTANFHTKGTLRFESINTNNTFSRILAMDINGNVSSRDVSTLGNNLWVADANGIHDVNTGHVGIGGLSSNLHTLNVEMMDNTIDGRATAKFISNDTWQTNLRIDNTTSNKAYSLIVGGTNNIFPSEGVGLGNFGVVNFATNNSTSTIPLIITSEDNVGISSRNGGSDNLPKSRLHVRDGDVYIDQIGSGVIMKSPNGQCWRMTMSNAGTPVFTSIPCP